jgi:hypothetical protein
MAPIRYSTKTVSIALLFVVTCLIFVSCDSLENDVSPEVPDVNIGNNEIRILPNGTAYIDLYSMVRAAGNVRLDISSQPTRGELSEISKGFLQYSPYSSFKSGKDSFRFSIYSMQNTLLTTDSITIILETDTTNLPCGYYAVNDFVYDIGDVDGPVSVDVTHNDFLCGDSTKVRVEIYRPDNTFPPYHGSATIQGNDITYFAGAGFQGFDKVFYKVYHEDDTSVYSFAVVYFEKTPPCEFLPQNDRFTLNLDSIQTDTVHLAVFANDMLCSTSINQYTFSILDDGHVGTTRPGPPIMYGLPAVITQSYTDSLAYQLCRNGDCKQAKVYINVIK